MSYIGLLNESITTTYTHVSASDDLTVGSSLRNLGTLTQVGDATFSGAVNGIPTAKIPEGTNLYYTTARTLTDAKTAISATDSTEIDFTYTTGNITASIKDNSVDISRIKTA